MEVIGKGPTIKELDLGTTQRLNNVKKVTNVVNETVNLKGDYRPQVAK